jgi:hypothetical protein
MSSASGKLPVTPTESKTTGTVGNFPRGSRETPGTSVSQAADRSEQARCRKSDVYVSGESDSSIVPKKRANKGSGPRRLGVPLPAESVEGRALTEENAEQSLLDRTQRRVPGSRGLLGVRAAAHGDLVPTCGLLVMIQGKSRMRSSRTYGSAREAARKGWPYRDNHYVIYRRGFD